MAPDSVLSSAQQEDEDEQAASLTGAIRPVGEGTSRSAGAVKERTALVGVAVVAVVHAVVFAPVAYRFIYRGADQPGPNLFPAHIEFAKEELRAWQAFAPESLWFFLVKAVNVVMPGSYEAAAFVVAVGFYAFFGVVLYALFSEVLEPSPRHRVLAGTLSVAFALMESPTALLGWNRFGEGHLFLSLYIPFSATSLASLGVNVVLIWQVGRFLEGSLPRRRLWVIPALTVFAGIAKPNLVPMVLVVAPLYPLVTSWSVRPDALKSAFRAFCLVTLPGAVSGVFQLLAILRYTPYTGGWRIAPLAELRDLDGMRPAFWTVLVAPAVVMLVYRRLVLSDAAVRVSLACSGIALVLSLVLERVGSPYRGDVLQLLQASIGVLYVFLGRQVLAVESDGRGSSGRRSWAYASFGFAVVAGLASWTYHVGLLIW